MYIKGGGILVNKKEMIKKKGFRMSPSLDTNETYSPATDFSKIKVGIKTLNDAVISLGQYKRINPRLGDKQEVLRAINTGNINRMIDIFHNMQLDPDHPERANIEEVTRKTVRAYNNLLTIYIEEDQENG